MLHEETRTDEDASLLVKLSILCLLVAVIEVRVEINFSDRKYTLCFYLMN